MISATRLLHVARRVMEVTRHSSSLSGKVAIVTASTEGIGYAIARRLGQDGAKVMISSRKQANVDKAIKTLHDEGIQVAGVVCHVGKDEDRKKMIQKTVEDFGKIDILISNAGINPVFCPILDITEQTWDKIFDINVKSAFLLIKECVPHMKKNAAITIISSIAGYDSFQGLGAYSVSKTALLGLTKTLASELAPDIRVNCIAPGIIQTKLSAALWKNEVQKEAALLKTPLKRIGTVEDCSGVASFLSSDDAAYITGETVVVAGGILSHL